MMIYVQPEQKISFPAAPWIVNDFLLLMKWFSFCFRCSHARGKGFKTTHTYHELTKQNERVEAL